MPIRILLVDDHVIMRQGLCALLEKEPGMEVVGEAATGREAVRLAHQCKPDIIIMDVSLPDLNGIDATRQIKSDVPTVKILGLSMHCDGQFATDMLRSGASGFLLKTSGSEELSRAIHEILAERTYMSPDVAALVANTFVRRDGDGGAADHLTPRQREVLQLYAAGLSTKEIAVRLGRSVKTVEMHRQNVMDKLKMRSIADLTKYAIRKGMASLDS